MISEHYLQYFIQLKIVHVDCIYNISMFTLILIN